MWVENPEVEGIFTLDLSETRAVGGFCGGVMVAKVTRKWVEGVLSAPCTRIHTPADRSRKKLKFFFKDRKDDP